MGGRRLSSSSDSVHRQPFRFGSLRTHDRHSATNLSAFETCNTTKHRMLNARSAALCRENLAAARTATCCPTRTWHEGRSPVWGSPRQRRKRPNPNRSTVIEKTVTEGYLARWLGWTRRQFRFRVTCVIGCYQQL